MRRKKLHVVWLWGLLFLMTVCGDDDYYYPSVELEFVVVETGEDGRIQALIPDKGEVLTVPEDRAGSTISPNTSRRVMNNYEVLSGESTATICSSQSLITPMPKPEDDPIYKDGIKLDPIEMVSIWLGRDYLDIILDLRVSAGKGHAFGIVGDVSELKTDGIVNMLLCHDANSDGEYYNRRACVSVPLMQYIDERNPGRTIRVKFKYYTYDKDGSLTESDRYHDPGSDYTPGQN